MWVYSSKTWTWRSEVLEVSEEIESLAAQTTAFISHPIFLYNQPSYFSSVWLTVLVQRTAETHGIPVCRWPLRPRDDELCAADQFSEPKMDHNSVHTSCFYMKLSFIECLSESWLHDQLRQSWYGQVSHVFSSWSSRSHSGNHDSSRKVVWFFELQMSISHRGIWLQENHRKPCGDETSCRSVQWPAFWPSRDTELFSGLNRVSDLLSVSCVPHSEVIWLLVSSNQKNTWSQNVFENAEMWKTPMRSWCIRVRLSCQLEDSTSAFKCLLRFAGFFVLLLEEQL